MLYHNHSSKIINHFFNEFKAYKEFIEINVKINHMQCHKKVKLDENTINFIQSNEIQDVDCIHINFLFPDYSEIIFSFTFNFGVFGYTIQYFTEKEIKDNEKNVDNLYLALKGSINDFYESIKNNDVNKYFQLIKNIKGF